MNLKALSKYDGDFETRYGDCILLYDESTLVVYDCGHQKHAESVMEFLAENACINSIHIVVSHNDGDHTAGVCDLIEALAEDNKYDVKIYTHQLLKYSDDILDMIKDGRRTHESVKKAILDEFDNIKAIIEKAKDNKFDTIEALEKTSVGPCEIVGPTAEKFIETAAKAIDDRESDRIGAGHVDETVMNAASVQLKATIKISEKLLLCGDATPDFLNNVNIYDIIQLPHHGKLENAQGIFEKLDDSYMKKYLISDNTGSGEVSGGSDKLVEYMKKEKYDPSQIYNTKKTQVLLNTTESTTSKCNMGNTINERRFLGDLDRI